MKLTRLEVKSYRSLFSEHQAFGLDIADGMNVIAGPNNVGKSNIFRALALAVDPDFEFNRALDMPAPWHYGKPTVTLTFQVPLRGTPRRERTLRYLEEYERRVRPEANKTYASAGIVKLRVTIEGAETTSGSRRQVFVTRGAGNQTLQDDDPLLVRTIKQFHKCFHFVLIPSGQSLEDLMAGKFRDILGNVLKEDLRDAFDAAERSRSTYEMELQTGLLQPLTDRLRTELSELFPEITEVALRPDVRSLDETLTRMRVEVCDAAATDLADKGTGVRGGLIIAMLGHFANVGKRSLLFAIEEPESFLHPAAQEMLRADLEDLARRNDVSLLVTTHSPYIVSRRPEAKVFAVDKGQWGQTVAVGEAGGNDPQAGVLGGLFRDRLVVELLDRANAMPADAKVLLVVEGWTDRRFAEIALTRAGRGDLLDGLAFVEAGFGNRGQGGASLAVMQALVTSSMFTAPVAVLLDNDEAGRAAEATLREIGTKPGVWKVNKTLFSYRLVFESGNAGFAYEAEDLWPDELLASFVATDEDSHLRGKSQRPNPEGGWHFDIAASSKTALVDHLNAEVTSAHCQRWVDLYERIRQATSV